MLTPTISHTLCVLSAGIYVFSLYMLPGRVRKLPRNNIEHMRWRMFTCTLSSVITLSLMAYYYESVRHNSHLHHTPLIEALGLELNVRAVRAAGTTLFLMGVFYTGPLITRLITLVMMCNYHIDYYGNMTLLKPDARKKAGFIHILKSFIGSKIQLLQSKGLESFRDHIFAPMSEELVFRSIIVVWMLSKYQMGSGMGGTSISKVAWEVARVCPLWFGLAHVHHGTSKIQDGIPWKTVAIQTLIQFVYTSIFGYIASILLLRTGSIFAPLVSHVVCNLIGLPDMGFFFRPHHPNSATEFSALYKYRLYLTFAHIGGLVLFSCLILPMTEEYSLTSALWYGRSHPIRA